jgi:hypothetical protein
MLLIYLKLVYQFKFISFSKLLRDYEFTCRQIWIQVDSFRFYENRQEIKNTNFSLISVFVTLKIRLIPIFHQWSWFMRQLWTEVYATHVFSFQHGRYKLKLIISRNHKFGLCLGVDCKISDLDQYLNSISYLFI